MYVHVYTYFHIGNQKFRIPHFKFLFTICNSATWYQHIWWTVFSEVIWYIMKKLASHRVTRKTPQRHTFFFHCLDLIIYHWICSKNVQIQTLKHHLSNSSWKSNKAVMKVILSALTLPHSDIAPQSNSHRLLQSKCQNHFVISHFFIANLRHL